MAALSFARVTPALLCVPAQPAPGQRASSQASSPNLMASDHQHYWRRAQHDSSDECGALRGAGIQFEETDLGTSGPRPMLVMLGSTSSPHADERHVAENGRGLSPSSATESKAQRALRLRAVAEQAEQEAAVAVARAAEARAAATAALNELLSER